MSKLEELLAELCPDGVEYKALGEIGKVSMCKRIMKAETNTSGGIPFFKIGTFGKEPDSYISQEKYDEYRMKFSFPNKGDILISAAGTIGRTVIYKGEPAYYQDSNIVWLAHDESIVSNNFLFYCYQMKPWVASTGGTIARLYNDNISKARIPIPPLPVQNEIVRILDNFTELTAELKTQLAAELVARKKQYEYYRDSLLTFEDEVEWKTLGTICDINTGSKPPKIHKELNIYQYINAGTTNSGFTENYNSDGGVVTTPSRGQGGIGFVGYQKNRFWLGPLCYRIQTVNEKHVLAKYVYYYLQNNKELILKIKNEGGVPSVNKVDLEKISVKIPPFVEQQRIVAILDRFDTLCNDISAGLPAEIAARTKQYEYYRDRLLTFPERA